ncbi:MAG: indolepyruvate oxidoreductase subunit beta [Lachnospiraceae bacterium]|nr:indolepyruvate oxidoreductase subunit beta [Lachnospiraceae bacterium]
MTNSCLLCGVGGQGTVLASKMLAFAAMEKGENVRTAETIGMAQRGGCVVSHVRVGGYIKSPLIPKGGADVLIAFEPAEAVRCLSYLKKDGTVVVNKKAVKPVTASLSGSTYDGSEMLAFLKSRVKNLIVVDGDVICEKCGSARVLNMVLLAAAAKSGALSMNIEEFKDIIEKKIPEKFRALNLKAVDMAEGEALL